MWFLIRGFPVSWCDQGVDCSLCRDVPSRISPYLVSLLLETKQRAFSLFLLTEEVLLQIMIVQYGKYMSKKSSECC